MIGRYYNYFKICGEGGLERNIDLERLMFLKQNESGDLIGMIVLHVNGFLHAGNEDF